MRYPTFFDHLELIGQRPTYRVYDRLKRCWWKPTYRASTGELEDLSLMPKGDLLMDTMTGGSHESVFPDRFLVVPDLKNFTAGLN